MIELLLALILLVNVVITIHQITKKEPEPPKSPDIHVHTWDKPAGHDEMQDGEEWKRNLD